MTINLSWLNMSIGEEFQFSKDSGINGIKPSANGSLKTSMTLETFRAELKKFGAIISEK